MPEVAVGKALATSQPQPYRTLPCFDHVHTCDRQQHELHEQISGISPYVTLRTEMRYKTVH